jgi:voltage-gated potassium channel
MLAIQGDARQETTLLDAGIEDADAIVAAIDDSNANIQIAITASQLAPELRVVVRVGDEMYESLARRAGADQVVIPDVASGECVMDELIGDVRRWIRDDDCCRLASAIAANGGSDGR